MKTNIQLLKLLRCEIENGGYYGMCEAADNLFRHNAITSIELDILSNIIHHNKTFFYHSHNFSPFILNAGYYYPISAIEPRLKWIDRMIKKYITS
jgi:hypothetical protein